MEFLCITYIIIGVISKTYGLSCYSCTDVNFDGESTDTDVCFTTAATGATTTTKATCTADSTGIINYCRTMFTVADGVVTGISRGCIGSNFDEDVNTAAVPGNNKCVSVIDATGNPTDTTNCYYHCTSDDCNTITTSSLSKCSSSCNIGVGGSCNYLTGTCVCTSAFSGSGCTTVVITTSTVQRKCVQCNSETDTGCATSTTSVNCPGTETYCSTATTAIIATDTTVFRTITTRGCTAAFKAVDECSFTDIYTDFPISSNPPGYKEFTCFSTCDTDGCNSNTADGVINGNEAIILQCVQCWDFTGAGSCDPSVVAGSVRTTCASGSTHCKSTVTYLTSNKTDLSYTEAEPAYDLVSVVRECATASVTSACTETTIGSLSLQKVTCTETCHSDGCNIGWPARPTCIHCQSSNPDADGYDECLENPPVATVCSLPYQGYCIIQDTGSQKDLGSSVQGYPRRITRGCSHYDIGTGCSSETLRGTEINMCNRTCTTDGCNVGTIIVSFGTENGTESTESGSTMPIQTFVAILIPTVLGWITQVHF